MKKIALCGKSCSGKTSIKNLLVESGLKSSISYTTRYPRENEVDGIDYHFVSRDEFIELIDKGFFFEYDDSFGDFYGTSMDDIINSDVFIFTPKAIETLRTNPVLSNQIKIVRLTAPTDVRIARSYERGATFIQTLSRLVKDASTLTDFSDYDISIDTSVTSKQECINIILKTEKQQ
jgi:guanylate kinase